MLDTSVKHGSSEEIARFVKGEAEKRAGIAGSLRTLVRPGGLFCIPEGESYDAKLVATAIFAVLIDDVNVYNQPQRERQMAEFATALTQFGLTIDDVFLMQRNRDAVTKLVSGEPDET